MDLECYHCQDKASFNDGIPEDILFHVYGWVLWGEEDGKQYAACPDCWFRCDLSYAGNKKKIDTKPKIVHPMDVFFSLETKI